MNAVVRISADVVQRAVDLIGPKPEDRDICAVHVRLAFDHVDTKRRDLPFIARRKSKAGKRAALRLQRALQTLATALADDELPDDVGLVIRRNGAGTVPTLTKAEVGAWLAYQIDHVALVQKRRPADFKIEPELKVIAAAEAHELMRTFGQKISAERGSKFCRLAALLFGKPSADLHYACRKAHHAQSSVP